MVNRLCLLLSYSAGVMCENDVQQPIFLMTLHDFLWRQTSSITCSGPRHRKIEELWIVSCGVIQGYRWLAVGPATSNPFRMKNARSNASTAWSPTSCGWV